MLQTSYMCALGDLSVHFWAPPPLKSFTSPLFTDQGLPQRIPPRNSYPKLTGAEAGWGLGRLRSLERVLQLTRESRTSRLAFSCLTWGLLLHPGLLQDSAGLGTCSGAICAAQKPAAPGSERRACLRAARISPEEGAKTRLGPGCPDKLGWGSRNGNQTKKNKPFPAAGWELRRVLELPAVPLPPSSTELSTSSRSSTECLFALKPKLREALPRRQPETARGNPPEQEAAFWGAQHEQPWFLAAQTGTHGTTEARRRVRRVRNKAAATQGDRSKLAGRKGAVLKRQAAKASSEGAKQHGLTEQENKHSWASSQPRLPLAPAHRGQH